jgi:hypothetical protein
MGRFLTPDWEDGDPEPIPYALWVDPQTLNLYSYAENNPTSKADPNGHCVEDLCVGEAIAVTAAVAAVSSFIASPTGQQIISNGLNALANTPNVVAGLFRGQAAPGSRPGKDFTPAGKRTIDAANAAKNGGKNACTKCGNDVRKQANKKGQPTPKDQLQRHHVVPKSQNGSGTPDNGQILCPECHIGEHWNSWIFSWWSEDAEDQMEARRNEEVTHRIVPVPEPDPPDPEPFPPDPCANGCTASPATDPGARPN